MCIVMGAMHGVEDLEVMHGAENLDAMHGVENMGTVMVSKKFWATCMGHVHGPQNFRAHYFSRKCTWPSKFCAWPIEVFSVCTWPSKFCAWPIEVFSVCAWPSNFLHVVLRAES